MSQLRGGKGPERFLVADGGFYSQTSGGLPARQLPSTGFISDIGQIKAPDGEFLGSGTDDIPSDFPVGGYFNPGFGALKYPRIPIWENREDRPGVLTRSFIGVNSKGERTPGVAVLFQGRALLENLDYLIAIGTRFTVDNFEWPEDVAKSLITRSFTPQNVIGIYTSLRGLPREGFKFTRPNIDGILKEPLAMSLLPTVLAMRTPDMPEGQYGFVSEQRVFKYKDQPYSEKAMPLYYHGLRVGYPEFRNHGWGKESVDLGLWAHPEVRQHPDAKYVHISANAIAWDINTRVPWLDATKCHPWSSPYRVGTLDWRAASWLVRQVAIGGEKLETSGILRNRYAFPNRGFSSEGLYGGALEKWQRVRAPQPDGSLGLGDLDVILSFYPVVN